VFAGGGVRGIALAGAAAGAWLAGHRFDRLVGTSAGALVASLVAAGYTAGEIALGVRTIPWRELADPAPGGSIPFVGRHVAILGSKAMYRGNRLEEIWTELLEAKGVRTFGDLDPGALRVVTTDVTHQRGVVLPDDLPRYDVDPHTFSVAQAVRMSSAVPFVFKPVALRERRRRHHRSVFVDGALAANFPLRLANQPGTSVIGFRLVPAASAHVHLGTLGPASLARAVIAAGIRAGDELPASVDDARIVDIPVGGDPLMFDITDETRDGLFEAGREAFRLSARQWAASPDLSIAVDQQRLVV
jgi:NTE family protein